jgi:2-polyprenyl-3-methyl-5-hydroxy-6-metoxy-1,4-benzoquinol methylase
MFRRAVVPLLDGLAERLAAPGAAFLDIGVGVAALSIAMARQWPLLRVVGIDPWEPALEIARGNVEEAGLTDRIELRCQTAEVLPDVAAFDLVWFSGPFVSADVMDEALRRVLHSLRPNGWILFGMLNTSGDELSASLARLRTVTWGGTPLTPAIGEALLQRAGFADVRSLPSPPTALASLVVGRRS